MSASPGENRIYIEPSGETVDVCSEDTVLSACLRKGVGLAHECASGGCGKCYFDLIEGEIFDRFPEAAGISAKAKSRGRYLGCQAVPLGNVRIKARLEARFKPAARPHMQTGTVIARRMLNHDMCELTVQLQQATVCLPGQFALVASPAFPHWRAYSVSHADADKWQFIVRRVPGGSASSLLVDGTSEGFELQVDGPYGHTVLRPGNRNVVCIGGGSGLAPLLAIVRAAALSPDRQIDLFYGGRRPEDLCPTRLWQESPVLAERVRLHLALSDPTVAAERGEYRGFVHELVEQGLTPAMVEQSDFYLCGPPPMIDATEAMLRQAGVQPESIAYDRFY